MLVLNTPVSVVGDRRIFVAVAVSRPIAIL